MAFKEINKRSHPLIRFVRAVRDGEDTELLFCEGQKIVEELFKAKLSPLQVLCTKERMDWVKNLSLKNRSVPFETFVASRPVMEFISDVKAPPGIIAIGPRPKIPSQIDFDRLQSNMILILSGFQLPQNVGALVRSAEAAGVKEVWLTKTSVDAYSPKAIRGSAGSAFRIPLRQDVELPSALDLLKSHAFHIFAASQHGRVSYTQVNWRGSKALVIGSEAHGLTDQDLAQMTEVLRIPMEGQVESLNAAVAGSVCLFEAARQRQEEPL